MAAARPPSPPPQIVIFGGDILATLRLRNLATQLAYQFRSFRANQGTCLYTERPDNDIKITAHDRGFHSAEPSPRCNQAGLRRYVDSLSGNFGPTSYICACGMWAHEAAIALARLLCMRRVQQM
jgi:hypothetical protein